MISKQTLKWRKVRTQYVGGDTYVAVDFPDLQIIGRPTDTNKQIYLVSSYGQIIAKGYNLNDMKRFGENSLRFRK